MMPLVLRSKAAGAMDGSQSSGNVSRFQWEGQVVQELRALELEGQRRQHAVIGMPCVPPYCVSVSML